jgi:hypothetical protein
MTEGRERFISKHVTAFTDVEIPEYSITNQQVLLRCLWCPYTVVAATQKEAVGIYEEQHKHLIMEHASLW